MTTSSQSQPTILVDAHAHCWSCYDVGMFLDGAYGNFRRASRQLGLQIHPQYCLLLAEAGEKRFFDEVLVSGQALASGWHVRRTAEVCAVEACRHKERKLTIVAGSQIACAEGIELLALGSRQDFAHRRPLAETLSDVRQTAAIPVLPWGFGKWWWRRGRLVAETLAACMEGPEFREREVFLGDNGGRPRWSWPPRLFRWGRRHRLRILPGSDPLPFPSEATRAGRYGFILRGPFDPQRPVQSIRALLQATPDQLPRFGQRETLIRFARHQLLMQFRKHFRSACSCEVWW